MLSTPNLIELQDAAEKATPGERVTCARCNGHGLVGHYIPDECPDCGGSGVNWRYPSGAVARYYSGPFLSGPPSQLIPPRTSK
jgi:RecJ-like exonuclease